MQARIICESVYNRTYDLGTESYCRALVLFGEYSPELLPNLVYRTGLHSDDESAAQDAAEWLACVLYHDDYDPPAMPIVNEPWEPTEEEAESAA